MYTFWKEHSSGGKRLQMLWPFDFRWDWKASSGDCHEVKNIQTQPAKWTRTMHGVDSIVLRNPVVEPGKRAGLSTGKMDINRQNIWIWCDILIFLYMQYKMYMYKHIFNVLDLEKNIRSRYKYSIRNWFQINLYELMDISFFQTFFKYIHFPETPSHLTNLITFFKCERSFVSTVPPISGSKLLWRWDVPSYLPKKAKTYQVASQAVAWSVVSVGCLTFTGRFFDSLCKKKRKTKGFGFLFKKTVNHQASTEQLTLTNTRCPWVLRIQNQMSVACHSKRLFELPTRWHWWLPQQKKHRQECLNTPPKKLVPKHNTFSSDIIVPDFWLDDWTNDGFTCWFQSFRFLSYQSEAMACIALACLLLGLKEAKLLIAS